MKETDKQPVWTDLARFLKKGPSTESLCAWIQISLPNHSEEEATRVQNDEPVSAGFCWWKGSRFGFQLASWNDVFGHLILSRRALVDLVFTMGFYHQISMTLNAFNVPLPDGVEAIFKEPTFPEWDDSDDV